MIRPTNPPLQGPGIRPLSGKLERPFFILEEAKDSV
jgi:hypothetical protein